MWRELISELLADLKPIRHVSQGPKFHPGVTPEQLDQAEERLGVRLPPALRALLQESDGVEALWGTHVIWPLHDVVKRNLDLRSDPWNHVNYAPFDRLLFFADAGVDGILFAFTVEADGTSGEAIYAWAPIGDERDWKAASLRQYLEGWLGGGLTV